MKSKYVYPLTKSCEFLFLTKSILFFCSTLQFHRYQLVTANVREPTSQEFNTHIRPLILNSTFASGPREFAAADVACIHALGHVGAQWTISPSALDQLKKELKHFIEQIEPANPQIYFDYSIIRKGQTNEQDVLPSGYIITLSGTHNASLSKANAQILLQMISSANQTKVLPR